MEKIYVLEEKNGKIMFYQVKEIRVILETLRVERTSCLNVYVYVTIFKQTA